MTDLLNTVIAALKTSTYLGSNVSRNWPPGFTSLPVAAASDSLTAVDWGDGHGLPLYHHYVIVHTWVRSDDTRLQAIHADIISKVEGTALKIRMERQNDLNEPGGSIHIVTEFTALGPL